LNKSGQENVGSESNGWKLFDSLILFEIALKHGFTVPGAFSSEFKQCLTISSHYWTFSTPRRHARNALIIRGNRYQSLRLCGVAWKMSSSVQSPATTF
jgi:hypothetical protein